LTSLLLDASTKLFTVKKVGTVIKNLNPKKAPEYDVTTGRILQKLPEMGIKYIIQCIYPLSIVIQSLCNTILKRDFFPPQWKTANDDYDPEA
jgi:hypothetical protein